MDNRIGFKVSSQRYDKETYRSLVSACKACVNKPVNPDQIFNLPRFGTGQRDNPKLFVVGQNPSRNVGYTLHGAHGIHYERGKLDEVDTIIYDLVTYLGYNIKEEVYATWAVKCPTHHNNIPTRFLSDRCLRAHLVKEIHDVNPSLILAVGMVASDSIGCFRMAPKVLDKHYKVWNIPNSGYICNSQVRTVANIVEIPHPMYVGQDKGIDKTRYFETIKEAHEYIRSKL